MSLGVKQGLTSVDISHSTFRDSWAFGVWIGPGGSMCPSPFANTYKPNAACTLVSGSTFIGNGLNAIFSVARNNFIAFNWFSDNHRNATASLAPGGQIDLDFDAENILVWNNVVVDGASSSGPPFTWADGIELHGRDIWLRSNRIHNNGGQGIYMEEAQDVLISDVNGFEGSYFTISRNNRRWGGGFTPCGPFPAVSIHAGPPSYRKTKNITIQNIALINGHQPAVKISKCGLSSAVLTENVVVSHSCLSGNIGGVSTETGSYIGTPTQVNVQTSGCHGY
jgi:hypothetical protein